MTNITTMKKLCNNSFLAKIFMKRIIIIIYIIVSGVIAIASAIYQTQPALFFINVFTINEGNSYYGIPVLFLTWIVLLIPLIMFLIFAKSIRKKGVENIASDRTEIFESRENTNKLLLTI